MKNKIKQTVFGALIAAAYFVLTWLSSLMGLAYGGIQLRISEALCVLPAFTPAAISGLAVGCALANLTSPFGLVDIIFGTVATAVAALLTRLIARRGLPAWLIPLPSVVINALLVGTEVAIFAAEASVAVFAIAAAETFVGQLAACYGLGLPLYYFIKSRNLA
jgi:uncharacterized membrane protein